MQLALRFQVHHLVVAGVFAACVPPGFESEVDPAGGDDSPPAVASGQASSIVAFPQGLEPLSSAPRKISLNGKIGGNGHAETWDGRVIIGSFGRWEVTVFRPEVVQALGGAVPSFPDAAFSNRIVLDETGAVTGLDPRPNAQNQSNQNALAIAPWPGRARNPYPCDTGWGEIAPSPSAYDCYEFWVYTERYYPSPRRLGRFRARVMVSQPRTAAASLVRAEPVPGPDGTFTELRVGRWRDGAGQVGALTYPAMPGGRTSSKLNGIEPSITFDGRLLVWNGDDRNTACTPVMGPLCGDFALDIVYSWNETPENPNSWTEPASLTDMSSFDGTVTIGGVAFTDLFPIARQPLHGADGFVYQSDRYLFAAYPWIDLDGANLVYAGVKSSPESGDEALRAGISVIGRSTNWTARHIDGPINSSRLAVRLFYSSPGAFPGMWAPYGNLRDPTAPLPIPYTAARPVLPLFGSNTNDYSELSFEDVVDGDYVLYLHMNEMVKVTDVLAADGNGTSSVYDLPWKGANPHTPDTSGNFNTGELFGAVFPGEDRPPANPNAAVSSANPVGCMGGSSADLDNNGKRGCDDPACFFSPLCPTVAWPIGGAPYRELSCDNRVDDDRDGGADCADPDCVDNLGFCLGASDTLPRPSKVGQSIVFRAGDYVRVAASGSHATPEALSVELWAYAGSAAAGCFGAGYTLAEKPGVWRLRLDASGRVIASVESNGTRSAVAPAPLACRAWTHVAMTYDVASGALVVYVGGLEARRETFGLGGFTTQSGDIYIGPRGAGSPGTPVLAIDEVKVSRVARTAREVARSAFLPRVAPALDNNLPAGVFLPPGLERQDLRIPAGNSWNDRRIALGERLFNDNRLSRGGQMSCATCHQQAFGFSDAYPTGRGFNQVVLRRRTSSAENRAFGVLQFWDGRAATLEEQTTMPLENPQEMNFTVAEAVAFLAGNGAYAADFATAFPGEGITRETIQKALAQYLRSRVLFANAAGDTAVSSGRTLFFGKARCSACHNGSNYSDELCHATHTALDQNGDQGRFEITGRNADRFAFKTPSLRDVRRRAAFFHDGSATHLEEVVDLYNQGGRPAAARDPDIRPLGLTPQEKADLVEFLRSLDSQPYAALTPPAPY